MQRAVFTDELGIAVHHLDIYGAVIDRQNAGACGDGKHYDTYCSQCHRQRFSALDPAEAKHHHQQKEGQEHTAEIRNTVRVQRIGKILGDCGHKVTEVTQRYRYKHQQKPYVTLFIRKHTSTNHTQRNKRNNSVCD